MVVEPPTIESILPVAVASWGEVDLFFVDSLMFLVLVLLPCDYTMAAWIKHKSVEEIAKALRTMVTKCAAHRHEVRILRCDGEKAIAAFSDELSRLGVIVEAEAGVVCPHVERKGRTIKDFVRGQRNGGLPWTMPLAILVMCFLFMATCCVLVDLGFTTSAVCTMCLSGLGTIMVQCFVIVFCIIGLFARCWIG